MKAEINRIKLTCPMSLLNIYLKNIRALRKTLIVNDNFIAEILENGRNFLFFIQSVFVHKSTTNGAIFG